MSAQPGSAAERDSATVTLVGLRCAGKTAVGRALAAALGRPFVDLDQVLAERWAGSSGAERVPPVGAVLERVGLAVFRDLEEAELALRLQGDGTLVLATGGGCVEREASRARLARTRCFWLDASAEELARRRAADPTPRPPLTDGDATAEAAELALRRAPWYEAVAEARIATGGRTVDEVVDAIRTRLEASDV